MPALLDMLLHATRREGHDARPWTTFAPPQTFDEVVELAAGATGAATATIFLPGRRARGLLAAAAAGSPTDAPPRVRERELATACLHAGTLLATALGRTAHSGDHPLAVGAALPLWHGGRRHGALTATWPEPGSPMSGRRHETLTILAIAAERLLEADGALAEGPTGERRFTPRPVHHADPEIRRVRQLD